MISGKELLCELLYHAQLAVPKDPTYASRYWKVAAAAFAIGSSGHAYCQRTQTPFPAVKREKIEVVRSAIGFLAGSLVMSLPTINRISGMALTRLGLLPNTVFAEVLCVATGIAIVAIARMIDSYTAAKRLRASAEEQQHEALRPQLQWRADNLPREDLGWISGYIAGQGRTMLSAYLARILYLRLV